MAVGSPSLRQSDRLLRSEGFLEAAKIKRGASDTTMMRIMEGMTPEALNAGLRKVAHRIRAEGNAGVTIGNKRYRVGIVDGTCIGGQQVSVLMMAGAVGSIVGAEPIEKYGKELEASFKLLGCVNRFYGYPVADICLGDGLYACTGFFKTCAAIGADGIVKTDNTGLNAIKEANEIFDSAGLLSGVDYQEGCDPQRGCAYRAWSVGDIAWMDTEIRLTVARIEETHFKGKLKGQTERFWMLSQSSRFSAVELRELGHGRWFIEANGFRCLNEQCHTKHIYSHNKKTAFLFSILNFIAFMLINSYRDWLAQWREHLKSLWDHGSFPLRLLRGCLLASVGILHNSS